jgi:beta-1,4-mannosyl-glycoprotein beta-1,4-N-acetylglucosaminyltransferase
MRNLLFMVTFFCSALDAKIFYCFMFCNEYELLKMQLEELYDSVDYFVIAESCETFRGTSKPYNFKDHEYLYEKYLKKIIYVPIKSQNFLGTGNDLVDPFTRENWQRNHLAIGLKHANRQDIIVHSDCDEFLDVRAIKKLSELLKIRPILTPVAHKKILSA